MSWELAGQIVAGLRMLGIVLGVVGALLVGIMAHKKEIPKSDFALLGWVTIVAGCAHLEIAVVFFELSRPYEIATGSFGVLLGAWLLQKARKEEGK